MLLYGHLDKQPEMVGWTQGYGPWIPHLEGDRLLAAAEPTTDTPCSGR